MKNLILITPSMDYEKEILDYKKEFLINEESMDGTAGLNNYDNIALWLQQLKKNSSKETVAEDFVPASTYLVVRKSDNKIVGMVDIRHFLNKALLLLGGHIGYSVRSSERKKGYGKEILKLALNYCKDLNLEKILVTCHKDNIPSAKIILANKGILQNEITLPNGTIISRYWIAI